MPVSAIQPSYQLLEQSSKMAHEAALEINARTQMPVEKPHHSISTRLNLKPLTFPISNP